MEGLKPMVDAAMAAGAYTDLGDGVSCVQCGNALESGNTGTVCRACTEKALGVAASTMGNPSQPPSSYYAATPDSVVMVTVHGIGVSVDFSQSLANLANSIRNSMTPEEVLMLVRLLAGSSAPKPSNDLPAEFWEAIEARQKITAIKELRAASTLGLRGCKDIVEAILDKEQDESEDEDKSDDKDDSEDKDESDKGESEDDDTDKSDDSGDEPEESEPGDDGDGDGQDDGDDFPDLEDIDLYGDDADADAAGELGGDQEVSALEAEVTDDAPSQADTATAEALAALAAKAADNGKSYGEDEIKAALATLGIQF